MSSLLFKTWLCSAQRLRILQKNRHLPRAQTNFFEAGKISLEISTNAVRNSFLRIAENFHSSFRLLLHRLTLTNRWQAFFRMQPPPVQRTAPYTKAGRLRRCLFQCCHDKRLWLDSDSICRPQAPLKAQNAFCSLYSRGRKAPDFSQGIQGRSCTAR